MSSDTQSRLQLLERELRVHRRIAVTMVVFLALAFAAFAFGPQEKSKSAHLLKKVGRYQIAGAGTSARASFMVLDTRTGITKRPQTNVAFDDIGK